MQVPIGKGTWISGLQNWGGVEIELISPHDSQLPSAVEKMIERQPCTPYHVCLEVDDLTTEIDRLKQKGFRQMGRILSSDVYGYKAEGVFLFGRGIGVVELVESCESRSESPNQS